MERILYNSRFAIIVTASIALLSWLTACSDDTDSDAQKAMVINADFEEATRATTQIPLDGSKYTMWANACFQADGASTPGDYFASPFLMFTYNAASNSYIATNYYYPLNGKMRFTAFASTKSSPSISSTVTRSSNYISKLTLDLTSNDILREVVYSDYTEVACPATSTPSLHFHRAQTNLRFKFIPADEYTCKHVIINSIEFKDLQWQGTLNVTYNSNGTATHSWTNTVAAANYTLDIVAKGTVPDETSDTRMRWDKDTQQGIPLEVGDGVHILPKTGRTQIIIRYTMLNDPTSTSVGGVGGAVNNNLLGRTDDYMRYLTYVIDAEPTKNWNASTQYYYNIKVHGNAQMNVENVAVDPIHVGTTGTMEI